MADNEMEAREKLSSISDGLNVLQDVRAGRVPRVKKLTCKLNSTIFYFAVRPHPQTFPVLRYCKHMHALYQTTPALLLSTVTLLHTSQSHMQ